VERILDMKVVHGKREWLCAWKGLDPTGDAWTPCWRPTKDVGKPLQVEFLDGQQARKARVLTIDVSPLDELCCQRRAIATTQMKELYASFGYVHETPIPGSPPFSLKSIAEPLPPGAGLQVWRGDHKHEWTKDRVHIVEMRLITPESRWAIFVPTSAGCPRKPAKGAGCDTRSAANRVPSDATVVGAIYLRYYHNEHQRGLVTFEIECHMAWINGATGAIVGPHLGDDSESPLKDADYMNELIAYAVVT
jgi:hypothetical protein